MISSGGRGRKRNEDSRGGRRDEEEGGTRRVKKKNEEVARGRIVDPLGLVTGLPTTQSSIRTKLVI